MSKLRPSFKEIVDLANEIAKDRMTNEESFETGLATGFVEELAANPNLRPTQNGNPIDFIMGVEAGIIWAIKQTALRQGAKLA